MLNETKMTIGNDDDIVSNVKPAKEEEPTLFTLYCSNVFQKEKNTYYETEAIIRNKNDLQIAVSKDHIFGKMEKNYRSESRWLEGNVLYADIDNIGSEKEEDWITPQKFIDDFREYEFYLVASRNNNLPKVDDKGKSYKPRPRFHIYFPIGKNINNKNLFKNYLIKLNTYKPYFDKSIKDVSRYFFGVNIQADNHFIEYHKGESILKLLDTLNEGQGVLRVVEKTAKDIENEVKKSGKIKNGNRHKTLLDLAGAWYAQKSITDNETADIENCRNYLLEMNEKLFENPLGKERIGENEEGGEFYNIAKYKRDNYNPFIFNNEDEAAAFIEREGLILFLENRNLFVMNINITNAENVYNLKTFFHRYREYKIRVENKTENKTEKKDKEKAVYENFTDWFLEKATDDKYTTLYNIEYNPALPIGKNKEKKIFNLYKGFAYKPVNHKLDISPIYDFTLDIINNGNLESNEYLLNWIASLFQFPARKTTAIGLKGLQGLGKNILFDLIGDILGRENYFYADKAEYLDNSFNAIFQKKLFCFFDEGVWSNDRKSLGFIKAAITNNDSIENEKYEKMKQNKTYYKIVMATNEEWVVKVEHGNRRFFIPSLNNKWSYFYCEGDKEKQKERDTYFEKLSKYFHFSNKKGRPYTQEELDFLDRVKEQFLYDMMERDITEWSWENIPITEELIYQQSLSEDPITKTIKDFIKGDIDIHYYKKETQPDKIYVLLDDIHTAIKEETGLKNISKAKIGRKMRELLPELALSKYDYFGKMKNCYVLDKDLRSYLSCFRFPGIVLSKMLNKNEVGRYLPPPQQDASTPKTDPGNRKCGNGQEPIEEGIEGVASYDDDMLEIEKIVQEVEDATAPDPYDDMLEIEKIAREVEDATAPDPYDDEAPKGGDHQWQGRPGGPFPRERTIAPPRGDFEKVYKQMEGIA
jgi:hypothetical protein